MLISIVVGVFALVTIYLTYVSAQASARSAEATEAQQKYDRLSSSADLMDDDKNAAIRLIGVASLSKLIDDQGVEPVEGYRALAVFVRDSKSTRWTDFRGRTSTAAPSCAPTWKERCSTAPTSPGADLTGADFSGADFSGANLKEASFKGAILIGAKFTDADLSGAHLEGAVLRETNFDWAILSGVTYDPKTVWPAGFYAPADRTVLE